MNTNKIEIYWNLIPTEYNQEKDANSFGFRVKCGEFDKVFTGIELAKGQISDWDAFRYIAYVCDFCREQTAKYIATKDMNSFNFSPNLQTKEIKEKIINRYTPQEYNDKIAKDLEEFKTNESDYKRR